MADRGELFVTEVLRDEIKARAEELGIELPSFGVGHSDPYEYPYPEDLKPGFSGQAEIFNEKGVIIGQVAFNLHLNPDYTGDTPYEDLAILGDIFVVLKAGKEG